MLLTLADMGLKDVQLSGGPGLADFMFGTRHYLRRCVRSGRNSAACG